MSPCPCPCHPQCLHATLSLTRVQSPTFCGLIYFPHVSHGRLPPADILALLCHSSCLTTVLWSHGFYLVFPHHHHLKKSRIYTRTCLTELYLLIYGDTYEPGFPGSGSCFPEISWPAIQSPQDVSTTFTPELNPHLRPKIHPHLRPISNFHFSSTDCRNGEGADAEEIEGSCRGAFQP